MKRKSIWKELNLPPPPKRSSKASGSPVAAPDPIGQEAALQSLRSNCVRTLLSALQTLNSEEGKPPAGDEAYPADAPGVAEAVERELFVHHQSVAGQEYKAAARTLVASLKRNADLRQQVLSGEVRPSQLVAMDARELATRQQREEYARLQELETRRVTLAGRGSGALSTNEYRCGRCGGSMCDYLDSGRRDIGKCETWGSKDGQGSSRLVTCLGCGHRWEVDDV
ncbi:hypothetical protein PLESTB_000059700 [Pleodorina starrii]|uniref:TFIIS central domain-containing protein n=1 Tax=Pleodorina starrii TaxID=330485 RepID=A0A9W6EXB6_9CHLO|nr:hypothetical protein PLESTM_001613300 [Pleodorina starrii]GLC48105.1 hypothetical protein PLESTB_000059700 [Pleodorina starrii]GLC67354.1 hypothetical protein PLESTF_000547100 [Pleodorina starrii]